MERTSKPRRVFQALSALSAIACLLLVVLWVRSYRTPDSAFGSITRSRTCEIDSVFGRVVIGTSVVQPPFTSLLPWETVSSTPGNWAPDPCWGMGDILSYGICGFYWSADARDATLIIPHWFPVLITATLAAAPWISWSRRFSLRTLLIATTLLAIVLGMTGFAIH